MFKLMLMLSSLILILMMLVAVAFITLLERKILGYMQIRLGPNKASIMGISQPLSDALKLYSKEMVKPFNSNFTSYFFSPSVSLILSLMIWFSLPIFKPILLMKMGLLMFFSILGLGVYPILMAGWSSNSNFSLIGGMRALAQTISYEVSLIFIILSNMILNNSMNFFKLMEVQKMFVYIFFMFNFLLWMISCTAELNRTPFDFAEGESELVSGFNTEYSSGTFAMIFMAEYMMILFFSSFSTIMFFGFYMSELKYFITVMLFIFFFVWMRATLPRYRYDLLMNFSWKIVLPSSTLNLFFFIFLNLTSK
ncbi:NADH dehydrogenase subunit 1 (mitochondrion) [Frankliniella occidentalis]|uniref:NADH-ubiquinone oxidoreductase chain 1 n=1 Tax=Frankliniella occidentalis TaxID=133901 RepID=I6NC79_FRAOC|nr:NADH dehydrogenase subunit 1 [Frankliniella occidentalis]AET08365.1 NADH dehydrogenase subunit 1 [Frankliniella occidentalis]